MVAGTDIAMWKARLEVLLQEMHVRQAGGLQKRQVRYKKDDSARKLFINTVALPGLRAGVMPTIHNEKMLFMGPMNNATLMYRSSNVKVVLSIGPMKSP